MVRSPSKIRRENAQIAARVFREWKTIGWGCKSLADYSYVEGLWGVSFIFMRGSFVSDTGESPRIFAFHGTKFIGIAVLRTLSASEDLVYPLVRLEQVYVLPKYRNRGIAKHMIRELYTYARDECSLITSHAGQAPVVRDVLIALGGRATCMRDALEQVIIFIPHPEQDIKELEEVCDKHYPDFFWQFESKP